MSASQTKAMRSVCEPIVAGHDCDLEDVIIRRAGKRRLVRLVIDHGAGGLTLDLVALISRDISAALDAGSVLGDAPYVLEVSSPGVDRPLREARHWDRAVGRLVRITPRTGDPFEGRLRARAHDDVVLDVDGRETTLALGDISQARVQVEFSRIEDSELDDLDSGDDDASASTKPEEH